jgi:hypothetical protein
MNRHMVDQLADTRAQIKALEATEAKLKSEISAQMGSADSLGGDEFIARQTLTERKGGMDEKALIAAGVDVEKFRKPASAVMTLRIEARAQELAA